MGVIKIVSFLKGATDLISGRSGSGTAANKIVHKMAYLTMQTKTMVRRESESYPIYVVFK